MLLLTRAIPQNEREPQKKGRSCLSPTRKQLAACAVIALAILAINDLFLFESVVVPTSSMRPTILPNERVLLRKIGYHTVHRFDVVVIANSATGKRLAKRVIGVPGDRIRVEDSWKVYINDIPLEYKNESSSRLVEAGHHFIAVESNLRSTFPTRFGKQDLILGPGEYFVLGDNRLASGDSRQFGPVTRQEIQGRICLIWYSYDLRERGLRFRRFLRIPR